MTEVLGRIRTADGYVFYHLADDSIVGLGIGYEFDDVSRYAYDREQHDNERQMGEHEESI
jgi:hypothetical protein